MRKLTIVLIFSVVLFFAGIGIFAYEVSQIKPQKIDISKQTQTMTTTLDEPANLYTKTYLESLGDVRVVVDQMKEEDSLQENEVRIEYPASCHIVQEEGVLDLQMDEVLNSNDNLEENIQIFKTKHYKEYYAKNNEVHIRIRYGKNLKDKIILKNEYYDD